VLTVVLIIAIIGIDLVLADRNPHKIGIREATLWVLFYVGLAALFAVLFLFRIATATITNDDYLHLSTAQQLLVGAVPVRDFLDPGELLFYATSAAAQLLLGRSVLSEVLLDAALLSIGQVLVFVLAARAARSTVVGLLATLFPVVIVARLYSYPKTLLYAGALALLWAYLDTRRRGLLWAIGGWIGLAFLFRHDHGAYIGVTAAVMLATAHGRDRAALLRAAVDVAAALALLVIPFLVFVQANGGVAFYVRGMLDTARGEYQRTVGQVPPFNLVWHGPLPLPAPPPPGEADPNVTAWLYRVTVTLPPLTVALLAWDWVRSRRGSAVTWVGMNHEAAKLTCAVVLALLMHTYLLRARSDSAIADVSALTGLLGAWVLARSLSAGWHGVRRLIGAEARGAWLGAGAAVSAADVEIAFSAVTARALRDTPGGDVARTFVVRAAAGVNPLPERVEKLGAMTAPYDYEGARYLSACTAESDRVLMTSGYRPELYYAAGRGFAAGRLYYLNSLAPSPEFKAWSLERLRAERVPIALVDSGDGEFAEAFPRLQGYLREHYRPAGRVEFWGSTFDVLADARIPPARTWGNGLPCYR
jgi:hypothetical protein